MPIFKGKKTHTMKRRIFLHSSMALSAGTLLSHNACTTPSNNSNQALKGNIRHSVSQWCFGKYPLEEFLPILQEIGIPAIDLIGPKDWPTLKKYISSPSPTLAQAAAWRELPWSASAGAMVLR